MGVCCTLITNILYWRTWNTPTMHTAIWLVEPCAPACVHVVRPIIYRQRIDTATSHSTRPTMKRALKSNSPQQFSCNLDLPAIVLQKSSATWIHSSCILNLQSLYIQRNSRLDRVQTGVRTSSAYIGGASVWYLRLGGWDLVLLSTMYMTVETPFWPKSPWHAPSVTRARAEARQESDRTESELDKNRLNTQHSNCKNRRRLINTQVCYS